MSEELRQLAGRLCRAGLLVLGAGESAVKALDVRLVALGLDSAEQLVFAVSDGYRAKFGLPEASVSARLASLQEHSILLLSVTEILNSSDPIKVAWTVPAAQEKPAEPQALESLQPGSRPTE